jgi:hypothetical protein
MKKLTTLVVSVLLMLCMSMSVMASDSPSRDTEPEKPSGGGEETSPKTGETTMPMTVAMAALAAIGVAQVARKKISE